MPQPLPRLLAAHEKREDDRRLAAILLETGAHVDDVEPTLTRTSAAGGDAMRLRGTPFVCVRNGPGGAIPGTDPVRALLAKESRRRRG